MKKGKKADASGEGADVHPAVAFILALFGDGRTTGKVYLSSLANDKPPPEGQRPEYRLTTRDAAQLVNFVETYDVKLRGMFFCVCTIADTRSKKNCLECVGIWADIDYKGVNATSEEIDRAIARLSRKPTAIVHSGHGRHLYWLLDKAIDAQANQERIEELLKLVCDVVAGDPQVCEISRLMRLPGSHNTKFDSWVDVRCEYLDGPRYTLEDLGAWLGDRSNPRQQPILERRAGSDSVSPVGRSGASPSSSNPFVRVAQEQGYQAPIDVDARLAAMSYGGAGDSGVHATHLSVTAALLNQGMSVDDVVEKVLGATQKKSGTGNWDWREEAKTIRGMCETWIKDPRYTPKDTASKESAEQPDGADAENVIDMGAARAKRKPKDPPPKDAKKKQMHIVLGKAVLEALRERGERIMTTNEGAYWYAGGSWSIVDDKDLKRQLNNEIEIGIQALDWVSNTKLRNETREWILVQPEVCRRNIKFDQHDAQVPVANGMLYPLTGMLEIAQPEHYVTWRVPYDYDAKAPCKVWLQMLDEILGDREPAVRKQYVAMLQRVLGIGLVNMIDKNLTRALVFIGPSNAGKSQLLEVITALYGGEVIALPLSALENPHGTSAFIRRLAWVVHEVFTEGKLHLSDVVKSIISREIIGLNIKNGPHVNRRYLGPIAWATNHPPTFREATKAITNRLILVHCRQVFVQNNPIGTAGIAAKDKCASPAHYVIKHEMPGVLAWAVEGLKKVLADRRLEIPLEAQAAAEEIQRDSNVAIGFFAECIECEPNGVVSQPDVYAAFASYWDETYGTDRVPSPKRLVQSVALMGDKRVAINDAEARMRKSGARYYGCIKLNPDGLKHWKNTITSDKWRAGKTTNVSAEGENPNQVMPPAWVDYTPVTLARSEQEKHPTKSFFYNSDGDDDGAMTDDGDEKGPMTERASPKTQSSARHPRQRPDPKGRTRF